MNPLSFRFDLNDPDIKQLQQELSQSQSREKIDIFNKLKSMQNLEASKLLNEI